MSNLPDASVGSLPAELDFAADPDASVERMNRAMAYLLALIRAAGARVPELEALADDLQANGLTRIAEALGPVYADAVRIAGALAQLEEQYLGDGVVPAILAQAATAAGTQLFTYGERHDSEEAAYRTRATQAFAAASHHHAVADVDGLADALNNRESVSVELFTTSGTWTRATGLRAAIVVTRGGGGGGGGGGYVAGPNSFYAGGGGGGGGGFSTATIVGTVLGATEAVTIGAGGMGGQGGTVATNYTGGDGFAGGTTSFGDRVAAKGGGGGGGGGNNRSGVGGAGGLGLESGGAGGTSTGNPTSLGGHSAGGQGTGRAAGGGGAGKGLATGTDRATAMATAGGVTFIAGLAGASPAQGRAGSDHLGMAPGGGGGSGGDDVDGYRGGSFGGGGGGGSALTAGAGRAGGMGGPGACLIINLF